MKDPGKYIPASRGEREGRKPAEETESEKVASLRRLIRTLCRLAQGIEEISQDLQFLVDGLDGLSPNSSRHAPTRRGANPLADNAEAPKQLAKLGVNSVRVVHDATGDSATVTVEHSREFRMPPGQAYLLEILCEDFGLRKDGLVGWKPLGLLVQRLREKTGRDLEPHAVVVSIHRLRVALRACGVNQFLVQTHRRLGYRFARKAKELPQIRGGLR